MLVAAVTVCVSIGSNKSPHACCLAGVVYHATGITVHAMQALFLLLLTPALAGSFLTLVTILSLKGYELDWAYW